MPREYRHIQEYEREIIELYEKGLTLREIGEKFGFTYKRMREFKNRYNRKQKKLEAGIALKRKGRPPKDYAVRKKRRSPQSCNSTVTKGFNTHRMHMLT